MTDTVVAPDVPVGAPHVVASRRLLAQRTRNGDLLLVDCSRVERLPPAVLALLVAASRVARCSGRAAAPRPRQPPRRRSAAQKRAHAPAAVRASAAARRVPGLPLPDPYARLTREDRRHVFATLQDRLAQTFKDLRGKGRLTDADIDATAREIRVALLEADVALPWSRTSSRP
jgi:hypothetical protein